MRQVAQSVAGGKTERRFARRMNRSLRIAADIERWRNALRFSALVWGFLCQGLFSSTKLFLGSVGQL
jgi:hypothetical protein